MRRAIPLLRCLATIALPAVALPARSAGAQGFPATTPAAPCAIVYSSHTPADEALQRGNFADAGQLFTTQLAAKPSVAGFTGLVEARLALDDTDAALDAAHQAAASFPQSGDALALTGDALLRQGLVPEAFAAFNRALTIDPCSSRAHFGLGRLSELASHHATAIQQFATARRLAPNDPAIAAAYTQAIPEALRGPALTEFLSHNPALPPAKLLALRTESELLNRNALCQPEQPVADASLDLLPIYFNGRTIRSWGLKLAINGASLPLLELDSSADGIILNPADAAKAGVHPVIAPTTQDVPYTAVADHLRIGSIDYRGCPVTVVPAAQLAGANSLIGTSFFRRNLIRINYAARTLSLSPLPDPLVRGAFGLTDPPPASTFAASRWTPVYITRGQMLLPTYINKKGPFLFALDSGLITSVYSPAVTSSQLFSLRESDSQLQGVSGPIVKVLPRDGGPTDRNQVRNVQGDLLRVSTPIKFPVLRYASTETGDFSVVSFDLTPFSHRAGIEVAALLGFHQLSNFRIVMNYRDGLVQLDYDQNHRYQDMQAQLRNH